MVYYIRLEFNVQIDARSNITHNTLRAGGRSFDKVVTMATGGGNGNGDAPAVFKCKNLTVIL